MEERARAVNRLQKTLEDTNIKLGDVATDIMGKSARAMLEALLAGQSDPAVLADLARGRMKAKRAQLEEALVGTVKPHHRFMLSEQLVLIDTLDEAIERVSGEIEHRLDPPSAPESASEDEAIERASREIERRLDPPLDPKSASEQPGDGEQEQPTEPSAAERAGEVQDAQPLTWAQAIVLLCSIPGISRRAAEGILAEIGIDMSRFPSSGHLASWAGMCPGNHESAGKRLSGRTNKGSPWLRKLLVQAAHAAAHSKNTSLSALYRRMAARHGAKKAMMAVGHAILVAIYHMLDRQVNYQELGSNYFDEHDRQVVEKRLVRRLEQLGYQVSLEPATQVA